MARRRWMSSVHVGAYRLTVAQSLAWHSADKDECEVVREEIRRAAQARLERTHELTTVILDARLDREPTAAARS